MAGTAPDDEEVPDEVDVAQPVVEQEDDRERRQRERQEDAPERLELRAAVDEGGLLELLRFGQEELPHHEGAECPLGPEDPEEDDTNEVFREG